MSHQATAAGPPEPWASKRDVADHYGYSVRWVEYQLTRGMPSVLIGGQRRFRLSETERWLLSGGEGDDA
jgi:hypothetical protein